MVKRHIHYFTSQLPPMLLYILFSYIGWGQFDLGTILLAAESVKNGLIPYADFHYIVTPGTLYIQSFLQSFTQLDALTVSRLWKGLTYSIMSLTSLLYIESRLKDKKIIEMLPLRFIYTYSLLFMLIGPIHETHVGYTPDAIFFSALGIMLATWPANNHNQSIKYAGYLSLGASVCFKQEIGMISMLIGMLLIIYERNTIKGQTSRQQITKTLFLITPMTIMLVYFHSMNLLSDLLRSTIIIPGEIKKSPLESIFAFATIGAGISPILIFSAINSIQITRRLNSRTAIPQRYKQTAIKKAAFSFATLAYATTIVISIGSTPTEVFGGLYKIAFFTSAYTIVLLHIGNIRHQKTHAYKDIKTENIAITALIILFSASTLAGNSLVRLHRIIIPLFIASALIILPLTLNTQKKDIALKRITITMSVLIVIFLAARTVNLYSPVLASPIKGNLSYIPELRCYTDNNIAHDLETIKDITEKTPGSRIFVYQADPIIYLYLNQTPPTYSHVFFSDWYPSSFDNQELERLIQTDIRYVITPKGYIRDDTFLFRKTDPIRDYIEDSYAIRTEGIHFILWEKAI